MVCLFFYSCSYKKCEIVVPSGTGHDEYLDLERESVGRYVVLNGPVGSCLALSESDELSHQQLREAWVRPVQARQGTYIQLVMVDGCCS